jgi:hypothetical protein
LADGLANAAFLDPESTAKFKDTDEAREKYDAEREDWMAAYVE